MISLAIPFPCGLKPQIMWKHIFSYCNYWHIMVVLQQRYESFFFFFESLNYFMILLPWHSFCVVMATWIDSSPSCDCMHSKIAHRITSKCKFLLWLLQQPLWVTISLATLGLHILCPLVKVSTKLTKTC